MNNKNYLINNHTKSINTKTFKVVGETKHFPPANKEWYNSVYSYNKNSIKLLATKDNMLYELIEAYFYLNKNKGLARSRRMRSSKLKNTVKKIFISKPEIKQTNDKAMVTLYVYNREKELLLRKIFIYSKNLIKKAIRKNNINIMYIKTKDKHKMFNIKSVFARSRRYFVKSKPLKSNIHNKYGNTNRLRDLFGLKLSNNLKMLTLAFKTFIHLDKFKFLRNKFFFSFLKYVLSIYNLKVRLNFKKSNKSIKLILYNEDKIILTDEFVYSNNIKVLKDINVRLLQCVKVILDINYIKDNLSLLYNEYYNNNFQKFIYRSLNYDIIISYFYMKLLINRFKFDKFLPGIKSLISKIYGKNTELNIVNLKYHHLNSDIFVESLITKLRKRLALLSTLKHSLSLVKTPNRIFFKHDNSNINKLKNLSVYKSLKIDNLQNSTNKDILNYTFKSIYPHTLSRDLINMNTNIAHHIVNKDKTDKILNVLDTVKYKWVTGIRLETKGRLTRRFTASRSVFKLKIKGNLNNIDYSRKQQNTDSSMSSLLRNQASSNLQYTFSSSKKRIGAFGVKGWISSF